MLAVTIPESPAATRFIRLLGNRSITEFNHAARRRRRMSSSASGSRRRRREAPHRHDAQRKRYPVLDMTDNELAKLHIRYMVGGTRSRRRAAVPFPVLNAPARCSSSSRTSPDWNICRSTTQPRRRLRPRPRRHQILRAQHDHSGARASTP
ncbi:MAG: hypothetical protein H6509_15835 [Bryobacterales bacterium]|nr:hypothetical protein [Bryobacterales bacterium]